MELHIRGHRVRLTSDLHQHAERRIRFALGRFTPRLRRVVVRLADVNGPRGGQDKACLIEAHLHPHGMVVIEDRDTDLFAAVSRGCERAGRTLARMMVKTREGAGDRRRLATAG